MPQLTRAQLHEALEAERDKHEAFKQQVLNVATRAKEENEWCDGGFERAMRELKLMDDTEVEATITITLTLEGVAKHVDPDDIDERFIRFSLEHLTDIGLDSGWKDTYIGVQQVVVNNITTR